MQTPRQKRAALIQLRDAVAQKMRSTAARLKEIPGWVELQLELSEIEPVPLDLAAIIEEVEVLAGRLNEKAAALVAEEESKRQERYDHGQAIHNDILERTELKKKGLLP